MIVWIYKSDSKCMRWICPQFTIWTASVPHLQNVHAQGSTFAYSCAHSFFFSCINHNLCVESDVRNFQALFCMYATFINEAPDLEWNSHVYTDVQKPLLHTLLHLQTAQRWRGFLVCLTFQLVLIRFHLNGFGCLLCVFFRWSSIRLWLITPCLIGLASLME